LYNYSVLFKMFKNQFWNTAIVASIAGLLGSCNQPTPTAQTSPTGTAAESSRSPVANVTGPNVVATTSVLCDLTQHIAATTIALNCLIKSGTDPHVYEPTPEDRKTLEDAKLILYSGYDFEPSIVKLFKLSSLPSIKVAVNEIAVPTPLKGEHREDGEAAEALDPHVWHDAQNGVKMVETIAKSLTQVAPENAALYTKNAQALNQKLTQIDAWIKTQVATIPPNSRKLVTTHDALGYYAKAYGIPVEGALGGISTSEKPTASRVAELVKIIQKAKVPTIFVERAINPKLIETVAKEAKVKLSEKELFVDGLGEPGSADETYAKMLVANTEAIVKGLGGNYTAFQAQ
jgi:manganese/iron transport system substrate-binding protein